MVRKVLLTIAISWLAAGCGLPEPGRRPDRLPGVVLDTGTWSLSASLALDDGHSSDALALSPGARGSPAAPVHAPAARRAVSA